MGNRCILVSAMKCTISLISICSLLAIHGSAFAKTYEEYRQACIEKMGLTEAQIATRLYNYQIGRCANYDLRADHSKDRMFRLLERSKKVLERSRISSKAGKQVIETQRERYREGWDARSRARSEVLSQRARRKALGLYESRYRVEKEKRALTRRERAKAAREACVNVQTSFRPNCVRAKYRLLGE